MHDMEIKSKYLGFVRYLHVQLLNSNIHCTPVFIHLNEGKVYGLFFVLPLPGATFQLTMGKWGEFSTRELPQQLLKWLTGVAHMHTPQNTLDIREYTHWLTFEMEEGWIYFCYVTIRNFFCARCVYVMRGALTHGICNCLGPLERPLPPDFHPLVLAFPHCHSLYANVTRLFLGLFSHSHTHYYAFYYFFVFVPPSTLFFPLRITSGFTQRITRWISRGKLLVTRLKVFPINSFSSLVS